MNRSGAVTRTALSTSNGSYRFDNLLAGTYQIVQDQPEAMLDSVESISTAANGIVAGVEVALRQVELVPRVVGILRQGRLQRNFQGYSTRPESDLVGLGVSAIGRIGPTYYQNQKRLDDYCGALDAGRLPVARGIELTPDDLVRRAVIQALACHFRLSIESIEIAHVIDFRRYFAAELADLERLEDEGLVEIGPDWIVVTPRGRLLTRSAYAHLGLEAPRTVMEQLDLLGSQPAPAVEAEEEV